MKIKLVCAGWFLIQNFWYWGRLLIWHRPSTRPTCTLICHLVEQSIVQLRQNACRLWGMVSKSRARLSWHTINPSCQIPLYKKFFGSSTEPTGDCSPPLRLLNPTFGEIVTVSPVPQFQFLFYAMPVWSAIFTIWLKIGKFLQMQL